MNTFYSFGFYKPGTSYRPILKVSLDEITQFNNAYIFVSTVFASGWASNSLTSHFTFPKIYQGYRLRYQCTDQRVDLGNDRLVMQ